METNLTAKKTYNVMLMLAGICFAIFAVGEIAEKIISLIPYFTPKYGYPSSFIISQLTSSIIPVILLVIILILCAFMFIGKPRIIFTLFFIPVGLYYIYLTISGAITVFTYISNYIDTISSGVSYSFSNPIFLYYALNNSVLTISSLIMVIGFAAAFIISLISFFRKKAVKVWFIPGIIICLGFLFEIISVIIRILYKPIISILASMTDRYISIGSSMNLSTILILVLSVVLGITLVLGTFFLGKGINKQYD